MDVRTFFEVSILKSKYFLVLIVYCVKTIVFVYLDDTICLNCLVVLVGTLSKLMEYLLKGCFGYWVVLYVIVFFVLLHRSKYRANCSVLFRHSKFHIFSVVLKYFNLLETLTQSFHHTKKRFVGKKYQCHLAAADEFFLTRIEFIHNL